MKVQLSAKPTAYHRPEMESPATGRKGKRKNTLVADDLSWTYLPATEKKTTEEGGESGGNGGTTTGGNTGGSTGGNTGNGGNNGGGGNGDEPETE